MSSQLTLSKRFYEWAKYLTITSKEKGLMSFSPDKWFKGQRYLINAILKEIESNSEVRQFIVLKARQLGITTALQAFDLFWVNAIKGVSLGFLCHSYEARPKLRENLRQLYLGLPKQMKVPLIVDNREMMLFANGSQIQFMHISVRENTKQTIARSQALVCLHATEVAFYDSADPQDEVLKSLMISSAKTHPARYIILETTANGFNSFCDRWYDSKNNPATKCIFIGWYMRDDYRIKKDNPLFKHYSYPLNKEEKDHVRLVKKLYDIDIDMEQIAWYRKTIETDFNGDMNYALQELPWHEDEAFRLTGLKFFDTETIMDLTKKVNSKKAKHLYIYADMKGIYIEEAHEKTSNFVMFEPPKDGEHSFIGADPSWGASPDSDRAVISVWKGYKNKIIQVAEFVESNLGVVEFAKLCLFFACFYKNAYLNIEIQGPGQSVLKELQNFKRSMYEIGEIKWNAKDKEFDISGIQDNIRYIKEYLYYRGDSLHRNYVKHWSTTPQTKSSLMASFKSLLKLGMIEPSSKELVQEMNWFIQDGSYLGAESGKHDDRVLASAIAIEFWRRHAYMRLPEYSETMQHEPIDFEKNITYLKATGLYDAIKPFVKR